MLKSRKSTDGRLDKGERASCKCGGTPDLLSGAGRHRAAAAHLQHRIAHDRLDQGNQGAAAKPEGNARRDRLSLIVAKDPVSDASYPPPLGGLGGRNGVR